MKILIACEYSGVVRDAMAANGHSVISCDLLPSEAAGPHYHGDVMDIITQDFDMMIAHPPCTYMANSGVSFLHKDPLRWIQLFAATEFFNALWDAPIEKIVIENPIMHKYAKRLIGGMQQSQVIQPWMFGHMEQKATCLWTKGLPLLRPTDIVKAQMDLLPKRERQRLHYLPPSPDRWKLRSTTFTGIAKALADQYAPPTT